MTVWKTATIGSVCTTFSGGTPSTSHPEYYGGDIAWIASADLNQGRIRSVKGRITRVGLERSSAKLVKSGTPLIALYGATAGVPAITYVDGAINQAILAMIPRAIESEYFFQWLQANRESIIDRYTQGGQPNLSGAIVRNIEIPLPPVSEQRRIGEVLGNADNLIAELERLITKKQAIKQGMMQELLTGRTRLPGFHQHWSSMTLSEVADYHRETVDPRRYPTRLFEHYSLPAFDSGQGPIKEHGSAIESIKCILPPGAVMVSKLNPRIPRVWAPEKIGKNGVASTEFIVLTARAGVNRSFLHWLLKSDAVADRMKLLAVGTTGSHARIHPTYVRAIEVQVPGEAEQHAIASILDDVSSELVILRARLDKTRAIKQGMMQELLTGRTRLPVPEAVA